MKDVKLVVCDIDNTLVQKHQPITERARNAIIEMRKRGILFGLASGRGTKQLKILDEQWGITSDVLIGMNGAELYDSIDGSDELLYVMEPEWLKECFEMLAPFKSDPYVVRNGRVLVREDNGAVIQSQKYLKGQDRAIVVEDDSEFWSEAGSKCGFRVKEEIMPAIEEHLKQFTFEGYIGFKTETTMYEFGNAEASKGKLLEMFCAKHDIDISKVWAFGDMTNDITLLESAGVGVCMANGSDDCKAVADMITELPVWEDGWADFIEKHILK